MVKVIGKSIHPACHVQEAGKYSRNKHFPSRKVIALTALLATSSLSTPLMANNGRLMFAKNNTTEFMEVENEPKSKINNIVTDIADLLLILGCATVAVFLGAMALGHSHESAEKS